MASKKICGIYRIENKINSKVYIGSSNNIKKRWNRHKRELRNNNHHSIALQRAWNKYGEENFQFEIVEYLDNNYNIKDKEQYWLDYYKSYERNFGYNIAKYSDNHERSEETRLKIGKSSKGRNIGENSSTVKITEEIALQIINDLLSNNYYLFEIADKYKTNASIVRSIYKHKTWKYLTEGVVFPTIKNAHHVRTTKLNDSIVLEIIKDIIDGEFNNYIIEKYNITEPTIRNIINKKSWKKLTHDIEFKRRIHSRKIVQLDKDLNLIRKWKNRIEACKTLGFKTAKMITECCNNKQKTAYGFKWMYLEDYEQLQKAV